ncbi:Co/Zn/Cd cation transporter-like protein [Melioribacter roseus P3M-2]|uniref:Co/Zn/Cd cation transporter-like protein n=1 Tax=Melioribacter roseus (strain DSM 23840 / JCM 17771 / VKM B-2668 / P3M-2) TaxID=1191523 RepID=I6ZXF0_MELRP|nr:cation transporter [Melioribacter roseus]AFN73738.1 Co/Zn/Cd cation transporter-like protein [Melioribacter roseus P3M-2]
MNRNYKTAFLLTYITIGYNILEGIISVAWGIEDETLSLLGFGIDSFVEVMSGIGLLHMLLRIKNNNGETSDKFERTALRITGAGFYILSAGLVVGSMINTYAGHKPETTVVGIIISVISIITMSVLIYYKMKIGKALQSEAIIADANCTKTCLYLSIILLAASAGYELTGIGGIDSIGAIAIAWFSYKEGKEAFEKAKGNLICSCGH